MSEPLLNVMKIMLLAGLYLFFLRVLWAVYNELRDSRHRVARRPETATLAQPGPTGGSRKAQRIASRRGASATAVIVGQLVVVEPAPMAGLTFALANEATIGRAPSCGIHLDDTYVSQVHARIFANHEGFFIEDLGSSNGTLRNGERLEATTALLPGDRLAIGTTVMEFS